MPWPYLITRIQLNFILAQFMFHSRPPERYLPPYRVRCDCKIIHVKLLLVYARPLSLTATVTIIFIDKAKSAADIGQQVIIPLQTSWFLKLLSIKMFNSYLLYNVVFLKIIVKCIYCILVKTYFISISGKFSFSLKGRNTVALERSVLVLFWKDVRQVRISFNKIIYVLVALGF